jgi:serine/threonine protein kinase
MNEPQDKKLAPGTMVGGFRIDRRLGQGGAGTVYAAEEPTIKKRVAIKVLRRALADDDGMAIRFEREARAVNEIRHPGIIDVFAIGRLDDGRPYLVMSLLEGCSLRDAIRGAGRIAPAEAWRIAREIADALAAAHDAGVVHRDLKPDNVFLERAAGAGRHSRVRVLDFGIAKIDVAPSTPGAEPMKLTGTGVPMGTPAYMAPEQWWGAGVTARTDQYALGAVLFEMLAGRPPFASQQYVELVQSHVHERPPALADVGASVPEAVEALVARLLAKAQDDRFASMSAVIEAGDLAFAGAGASPAEPSTAPLAAPSQPTPEGVAAATSPTEIASDAGLPVALSAEPSLRGYLSLHAAILVLGLAGVVAVGYAGVDRHDVLEWINMGGWGQWLIVLWYLFAVLALASVARTRAATGAASNAGFWIALFPALQGAFATYTGWRTTLRSMAQGGPLDQLAVFSQGTYEANAARFLGFSVSAILFLSVAALPGVSGMASATTTLRGALGVRRREALAVAAGLGGIALVAAVVGAPSGALIAAAAAVAVASSAALPTIHVETAARDELERAAAGILAVGLAVAAGVTRIEAHEASLWVEPATRAARVTEILAVQAERDVTTPVAVISLAVLAAVEVLRLRRLQPLRVLTRPGYGAEPGSAGRSPIVNLSTGTALLVTAVALGVAGDFVQHGRFSEKRAALLAELGAQFALFARLDPPPGDALDRASFPPHRATALQVTRDVIAVNGRGVARLAALDAPEGALHVAADLNRALAQAELTALPDETGQADADRVDLSVSIDRAVDAGALLHLLRIARGAGARRVEVLLTRGESPRLGQGGPPEIAVVIPADFVAVPAELADAGFDLPPGEPFGRLTPSLVVQALAARGPVAIALGAPGR